MTPKLSCHLIAADVGNSAVKLGRFRVSTDPEQPHANIDLQLDGVYPTVVSGKDMRAIDTAESAAQTSRGSVAAAPRRRTLLVRSERQSAD